MKSFDIDDPIAKLSQIGPKRAKAFSNQQIYSVRDLLYYFPRKHLDRTNITQIKNLSRGEKYNIIGYVEALGERSTRYKKIFQVILSDGTGLITLTWFNSGRYLKKLFNIEGYSLETFKFSSFKNFEAKIITPDGDIAFKMRLIFPRWHLYFIQSDELSSKIASKIEQSVDLLKNLKKGYDQQ